ncbi:MAG TPA: universal stress protein [Polyangiaceae bacterium]|nr:universal stress protein [Polyangiaceae bacterium]
MSAFTQVRSGAPCLPQASTLVAAIGEADVGRLVTITALRIARTWPGSRLHLLRVLEPASGGAPGPERLYGHERGRLARYVRLSREAPCIEVQGHLLFGQTVTTIARFAEEAGAHLLVMGTHDAGPTTDLAFGSVADALLRKLPCPALLVRPPRPSSPEQCSGSTCAGCPHLRGASFDTALPCRAPAGLRDPGLGS